MNAQAVSLTEAGALMVAALPRLRRYACALVGDRAAADDLVQDTLERAWARIDSWRPGADMRAWLFSILHNLHVDQRRRPAVATVPLDDEALALPVRASQTDGLDMRDLETALRQIPTEQREVLLLVALEDMSYEEIARTLGVAGAQAFLPDPDVDRLHQALGRCVQPTRRQQVGDGLRKIADVAQRLRRKGRAKVHLRQRPFDMVAQTVDASSKLSQVSR